MCDRLIKLFLFKLNQLQWTETHFWVDSFSNFTYITLFSVQICFIAYGPQKLLNEIEGLKKAILEQLHRNKPPENCSTDKNVRMIISEKSIIKSKYFCVTVGDIFTANAAP